MKDFPIFGAKIQIPRLIIKGSNLLSQFDKVSQLLKKDEIWSASFSFSPDLSASLLAESTMQRPKEVAKDAFSF